MKPLTYLGFTIFSVFMQFCVMEFIHERFQLDGDSIRSNDTLNTSIISKIKRKPHALFYRAETNKMSFEAYNEGQSTKYNNISLDDITTTENALSTALEVFYDENTSDADDYFTTESYFSSSEFDNVTEITLIDKTSSTTAKPNTKKKTVSKGNCYCDLLHKKCDINCCCDSDCTEEDRKLFINCGKEGCTKSREENLYFCDTYPTCGKHSSTGAFNDLFCLVKVNLPEKRIKSHFKLDGATINTTYKWKTDTKHQSHLSYIKKKYEYGDPLWLLQNTSIFSMFLPTTVTSNYCSGTKTIKFLVNEGIKCNVKLDDIYVFQALKTIERSQLISVTDLSLNRTALNCSTLHCTNWTISVCSDATCVDYNSSTHAPKCTDEYCNNVALKLEFIFYYSELKITNATLKLHMNKIRINMPLLEQEVFVKWYLGNESIENTIQLSGNPGYRSGLPIITSSALKNHTSSFYNQTKFSKTSITLPNNQDGKCVWTKDSNKTLLFGLNTRSKCRLYFQHNILTKNASNACRNIQVEIKKYLRLNQRLYVSPYGNPRDLNDDKWIPLEVYNETFLYGEYQSQETKLKCFNLVTRYQFTIAFADTSEVVNKEENKIIKAILDATPSNLTFYSSEVSLVLTADVRFVDISKPISEFAKGPHLNIHLPNNFFLDYPSNKCFKLGTDITIVIFFSLLVLNNK